MVYAQILNSVIINIVELTDSTLVSLFSEGFDFFIEIESLSPVPAVDWFYDTVSTNFFPPATLALINSNVVVQVIQNCDAYITNNSSSYQYIVDITTMNPQPIVGSTYDGTNFALPQSYYQELISSAIQFGNSLIIQAAANNVSLGITQAGETLNVINYTAILVQCLSTGSLYEAINEINVMIADTSETKTNLSPFITNDILYDYLNQIQTWLEIPLTTNPGP